MDSPYKGKPVKQWLNVTKRLIRKHPLEMREIADVVLAAWDSIFSLKMGAKGFQIGKDFFPKPQIMGFFLHELIPLELAARYPAEWRVEESPADKDIVCIRDNYFSIEIKTSSNPNHVFGNRSYAQQTTRGKKAKSGYYLAVNFEKFTKTKKDPKLRLVRFGWIDSSDWIGQKAATGQQPRLPLEVETQKLIELYRKP